VTLDVFGHALRESSPWEQDLVGLYAGPQTVAEMKRTNRDKDWSFITALGLRMLEADDAKGWLHIFNADTLAKLVQTIPCPPEIAGKRPALDLALSSDPRIAGALNAERKFWEELDRRRIQMMERHLRPYVAAIRKARSGRQLPLLEEHRLRIECASKHLAENPLKDYGLQRYIEETRNGLIDSGLIPKEALAWLPDVMVYFEFLNG